jgi:CRISPR-associated endonuclease/helicase Cas3
LPDGGKADDRALLSRLESTEIPLGRDRWKGRIGLPDPAGIEAEIHAFLKRGGEKLTRFGVGFLARMVFSCLVDADFLATEWFYDRGKAHARKRLPDPAALAPILSAHLDAAFSGRLGEINRQRAAILNACRNAAAQDTGVFSLDVPTGGGKTLSSLSFALEHAARHGLDRVIYAIPYTSIIDQTTEEFRQAPAPPVPTRVGHHSAVGSRSRESRMNRSGAPAASRDRIDAGDRHHDGAALRLTLFQSPEPLPRACIVLRAVIVLTKCRRCRSIGCHPACRLA